MKIDFDTFFEAMKSFTYNDGNEDFMSKETSERIDKLMPILEQDKNISSNLFEEIFELFVTSSEDGFETGFKMACELLQMMFVPNNRQHTTTKKGMVFNDKTFFDMLYYNNDDTYFIDIYSDETAHKITELDNLLKEELSSQQYLELSSKINVVEANLQSDCFRSGLFTGINFMKYLLK